MADFCHQCSIDMFGKDFHDLANITDPEAWKHGMACTVICEGCGAIQVDPQGWCVSNDCLRAGKRGHGNDRDKFKPPDETKFLPPTEWTPPPKGSSEDDDELCS